MRACYPWIDRVRLSAAWHLKLPGQMFRLGLSRHFNWCAITSVYDSRAFECAEYDHTLVARDPMKSETAAWQNSELQAPE
jgi:hypothetical protein